MSPKEIERATGARVAGVVRFDERFGSEFANDARINVRRRGTVYRLRRATPLITRRGGGRVTVTALGASQIVFWAAAPGSYDVRVRYSPYWAAPHGACVRPGPGGMTQVEVAAPGLVRLAIDLSLSAIADQTVGVGSPVAACVPA
jgi:hypothetical protein